MIALVTLCVQSECVHIIIDLIMILKCVENAARIRNMKKRQFNF